MVPKIRSAYNLLQAPYIKIEAKITQAGITNGKSNLSQEEEYLIAPSAKKIAVYIVNQLFGSDLVTQTDGLDIGWLMPTLKEVLELAVYQTEAFIYLRKFNDKIYLECFKKSDIHDLVQNFDVVEQATIIQEYDSPLPNEKATYILKRKMKFADGKSIVEYKSYRKESKEELPINIKTFNNLFGTDYEEKYILPYECLINVDIGQDFFKDSRRLIMNEMKVFNTFSEEVDKTKTRIATSQHFQSGDVVSNWKPQSTQYNFQTFSIDQLQDYFVLLPGDKGHTTFEFLQGNLRVDQYVNAFKFYDYQVIQLAGFSPITFGYEKDTYQNTENIDLNKNSSEMTIEAIKTQIESQINRLIENIIKAQRAVKGITKNILPENLIWDYGTNEKFDDMKKLKVLGSIQKVSHVPTSYKAKIVYPILKKLIDEDLEDNEISNLIDELKKEAEFLKIDYGEI